MAPNDTHRLPLNSLYESIDQAFLEVWETCRPFYTLTSSPDFSIDNIPPLLEDALLAQNEKIGEVAASTQPKQSVSYKCEKQCSNAVLAAGMITDFG
jgi:hypothetical protein